MKILSQREQFAYRFVVGMTDEEYEAHRQYLDRAVTEMNKAGIESHTMPQYTRTAANGHSRWNRARRQAHADIIRHFYNQMQSAPQEGKGLILGGLGGAGKGHAMQQPDVPLDASNYYRVDPDEIKKEMVRRGMVPSMDEINQERMSRGMAPLDRHLSPMERSGLIHEEASDLAKRLANVGYRQKRNLAWDITMSGEKSVGQRIDDMRNHGYGQVDGAFIDASPGVARKRVVQRHRKDEEPFREAGAGLGGRYVQEDLTRGHLPSPESGLRSKNSEVFHALRGKFDNSILIDGDVDRPSVINQHGQRWSQLPDGRQLPTWQPPPAAGGGTFFPTRQLSPQNSPMPPQQPPGGGMMPTRQIRNTQASRRVVPDGYINYWDRRGR